MSQEETLPQTVSQDEKTLAALAHGSILLGLFTNGIGGIVAALVIWAIQKDKSKYVALQALQSLVYQAITFVVTMLAWCCWGLLWTAMILIPITASPGAYEQTPPAGMWIGLILIVIPLAIWGLTIFYGLWGAARCLGGHDFRYAIIGRWLENQQ
ncbi:MAG: DUF4870 domain-containing protein [Anaerolineae bacterium]|jgi:uncharacterized Tic20 family protein